MRVIDDELDEHLVAGPEQRLRAQANAVVEQFDVAPGVALSVASNLKKNASLGANGLLRVILAGSSSATRVGA